MAAWRCFPHGSGRAFSLAAFDTAHSFDYINQPRIPASKSGQCVRMAAASMAAIVAGQQNFVLAEFIAELVYYQVLHQGTVQKTSTSI
jgi:hypothetical protein